MAAAPPIENSALGLTMLAADRKVVVTKEERHQAALVRYAPWNGARRVAVELQFAPGGRPEQQVIEVLLDGLRVGELTSLMSRRYGPVIEDVLRRGGRPGCLADVVAGTRGIEVELRLPAVATTPQPRRRGQRRSRKPLWIGGGVVVALVIIGGNVGGGKPADPAAPPTFAAAPVTVPPAARTAAALPPTSAPASATAQPQSRPQPRPAPEPYPDPNRDQEPVAAPAPRASYKNCTEVRAAGNAPLLVGEPGYSRKLDRDGDGVACE